MSTLGVAIKAELGAIITELEHKYDTATDDVAAARDITVAKAIRDRMLDTVHGYDNVAPRGEAAVVAALASLVGDLGHAALDAYEELAATARRLSDATANWAATGRLHADPGYAEDAAFLRELEALRALLDRPRERETGRIVIGGKTEEDVAP